MKYLVQVISFIFSLVLAVSSSPNITAVLEKNIEFSLFNRVLMLSSVAMDINSRSSLTILAVDDSILSPVVNRFGGNPSSGVIGDILRYHVLLEYLEELEIRSMTNASGFLITTLYQTTGRAASNDGFLNVTSSVSGPIGFGLPTGGGPPAASLVKSVASFRYNLSVFEIDRVLIPIGVSNEDARQVDIISMLQKAGKFNNLVALLKNSGVAAALTEKETGAGITVLAPSDDAFNALPSAALTKLTDDQKATILKYHVLSNYFTLGSLQRLSNPAASTEASGSNGGNYTLGISFFKGEVVIDTSVVKAQVTNTLYDQPPVSIFSVDTVLQPPEIFAASPIAAPLRTPIPEFAPFPGAPTFPTPAPVAESPSPMLTPLHSSFPTLSPAFVPELSPASTSPELSPAPGPSSSVNAGGGASAAFSNLRGSCVRLILMTFQLVMVTLLAAMDGILY